MANHAHKQIRDAVVTAVTGLVTTGANVFANRLYSLADVSLPALRIRLGQEDATPQSIHAPHVQERVLRLVVEVCAKSDTALADSIDQISKEVEIALSTALNISGVRVQPVYAG